MYSCSIHLFHFAQCQVFSSFEIHSTNGKELLDHQNFCFNYHLAQSQLWIKHCEIQTQIRNQKDMQDQLNELYEEAEPDSAPVVFENIDNSNDGIHGILHPITLSNFEKSEFYHI
ncbi:hypothetical protein VP01_1621g1 [Puccinia sorghi]|uniref:Uncharacterized protein n=1 Tax=Puccinia sorghi TaxID=27349 RepID=A0A0L6VIU5_9BASI|nr:hypothetical protein VP01_1621g1 [Puccinia sorghi]